MIEFSKLGNSYNFDSYRDIDVLKGSDLDRIRMSI